MKCILHPIDPRRIDAAKKLKSEVSSAMSDYKNGKANISTFSASTAKSIGKFALENLKITVTPVLY